MEMDDSISHKGQYIGQYTTERKLAVVAYAEESSNTEAARRHSVDRRCVVRWRHNKAALLAQSLQRGIGTKKRLSGGGKKAMLPGIESELLDLIYDMRIVRRVAVSSKMICKKAQVLYKQKPLNLPLAREHLNLALWPAMAGTTTF